MARTRPCTLGAGNQGVEMRNHAVFVDKNGRLGILLSYDDEGAKLLTDWKKFIITAYAANGEEIKEWATATQVETYDEKDFKYFWENVGVV